MTDKTERSETMLTCMNDHCCHYAEAHQGNCDNEYFDDDISSCWVYQATRPDAKDTAAMINTAYDIMEVWDTSGSQYNTELKKEWLRKAREIHGAVPSL